MRWGSRFGPLLLAVAALFSQGAIAQSRGDSAQSTQPYPSRPVSLIVPYGAGGGPDVLARRLALGLAERMGQPVVVINRPGATGLAGTQTLARSSPDGYTLGYISMATLVAQMMMTRPPVDLPRETTVISAPFQQYTVLLTQPSESIRDARALIARLKTRGGSINFSSGGNGTPAHLAGELFRRAAGLDAQHIPYKQLTGALVDVMNGQVQFIFSIGGSAVPLVKSGKLTALAVAAPKRLDVLPEVPTLAESTGIELDFSSWNALIAPVGTPETVLRQLNKLVGEIVQDSEHRKAFIALGLDLMDSPYDQAANLLRSEGARWARFVRDTGISAD